MTGLLPYLYVPLQAWAGVTWFFVPFSWENLWSMIADTKADVILSLPQTVTELWARLTVVMELLADDWPLPLLLAGLAGLLWGGPGVGRRERWGLTLSWVPYLAVGLIIWEGRVSDALLAVKMPVVALSALGLALLVHSIWQWKPVWGKALVVAGLAAVVFLFVVRRPEILALTRDGGAREAVAMVSLVEPDPDGRPTAFMAYWGDAYWQLAYAQGIEGQFPDLLLVDHNRDFGAVLAHGYRLLTFNRSFGVWSMEWWEGRIGAAIHLTSVAPGIVEVRTEPEMGPVAPRDEVLHVFDGSLAIREVQMSPVSSDTLEVSIAWQALHGDLDDYRTAVLIVTQNPPRKAEQIVSYVAQEHLAGGTYPASRLVAGEVVWDHFQLTTSPEARWLSIRTLEAADGSLRFRDRDRFALPLPGAQPAGSD